MDKQYCLKLWKKNSLNKNVKLYTQLHFALLKILDFNNHLIHRYSKITRITEKKITEIHTQKRS